MNRSLILAAAGVATLCAHADAGFLGFITYARQVGSDLVIDMFAGTSNSTDRVLACYNVSCATNLAGGFLQNPTGSGAQPWKPTATSTNNSIDSFFTIGCTGGQQIYGEYFASASSAPDPAWGGGQSDNSIGAYGISGWFASNPPSIDTKAISLNFFNGNYARYDSGPTLPNGSIAGSPGSAGAQWGVWCAHLVLANASLQNLSFVAGNVTYPLLPTVTFDFGWRANVNVRDGVTGQTSAFYGNAVPAPGALAALGLAMALRPRRRA